MAYRKIATVLAFAGAITASSPSRAQIFELVQPDVGYAGQAYGVHWGDVNGDELPDFWLSKHNPHAVIAGARGGALYVNQGNGRFVDKTSELLVTPLAASDYHGAAWGDFDNDGNSDLIQLTGSSQGFEFGVSPRVLLRNEGGTLRDQAQLYGVAMFQGRGWMPLWLDFNRDGRLDMLHGVDPRPSPSSVFRQRPNGTFADVRVQSGYDVTDGLFGMLSDINMDNRAELISVNFKGIARIYNLTNPQFTDIAPIWLAGVNIPTFSDIAIADFDNDLRPDIYITRIGFKDEVVISPDRKELKWYYSGVLNISKRLSFSAVGDISFNLGKLAAREEIRIGQNGYHPAAGAFILSPSAPENQGIAPHADNVPGIYIGHEAGIWTYEFVDKVNLDTRGGIITASGPITITNPSEVPLNPTPEPSQILINKPGGFVDRSVESTIASRVITGNFVATGDFDNDGDVDIYIDQSSWAANRRNYFLENQGNGTFSRLVNHGAEGSLLGTGGSIAVADYDLDGFLDLAIVNSNTHGPVYFPQNADAPLQLFHNRGRLHSANNWLEVRLRGTQSNRDAVGAKVIITTAAGRQLREQNNGAHFAAQDFKTLHFGLGSHEVVDRLDVTWPSGQKSHQTNIDANQIIDVTEEAASGVN